MQIWCDINPITVSDEKVDVILKIEGRKTIMRFSLPLMKKLSTCWLDVREGETQRKKRGKERRGRPPKKTERREGFKKKNQGLSFFGAIPYPKLQTGPLPFLTRTL